MASVAVRAVPSSPRQTMADPSPLASCAGRGTSESARALIDGITHALGAEATEAAAAGEDRAAQVLVNLLADALDALDALGDA
jgi:signal transduction histidine kinase